MAAQVKMQALMAEKTDEVDSGWFVIDRAVLSEVLPWEQL